MSSQIALSKVFRPFVLAELRRDSRWDDYRVAHGLKSNNLSSAETRAACGFMGIDLDVLYARFLATPEAPDSADKEEALDMAESTPPAAPAIAAPASQGQSAGPGFEGRDVADLISEALAPASAHMTPHLQAILPGLLQPLASAASAGPRVVKEVRHAPAPGASVPPDVRVNSRQTAWSVFGLKRGSQASQWRRVLENTVAVCDYADAPKVDHDFTWQPEILAKMTACDLQGLNLWIYGPAGTGKTESAMQYAARLKRPFFRVAIDRNLEPQDLRGQTVLAKGGGMEWQDGLWTMALRVPYAVILVDEPSLLRPGSLAVFQTTLDTRKLALASGETVEVAQGVFIIFADNTAGVGDDSGRYLETAPLNAAFMDRFALKVPYDFLPPKQEAAMLSRRSTLPVEATAIMVDYAGLTRGRAAAAQLTMGVTPRQLINWARAVKAGLPSAVVFTDAIVNGAAPEDRETLLMLAATTLQSDHARIDGLANGNIPEAPAAPAIELPPPSAAGARFPDESL